MVPDNGKLRHIAGIVAERVIERTSARENELIQKITDLAKSKTEGTKVVPIVTQEPP